MKFLLQVFALLPLFARANGADSPWNPSEDEASFVAFPDSVKDRLKNEALLYKSEGYPLPTLRIFEEYPEPTDKNKRIWPMIKSINTRLHPVLWPRVQYYVQEGLEFGCRKPDPDSKTGETLPITTSHCHRHCLHQGRYCLNDPDVDGAARRTALKEINRRICMDTIYHAKDPRVLSYLEHFESMGCGSDSPPVGYRNCSLTAMNLVGMKYKDIASCVSEDKYDKDVPNEAMNGNLRQLKKHQKFNYTMPYVTLDNQKLVDKPLDTKSIFQEYCSNFPSLAEQPLACHACKDCGDVQNCLWTLKCNGKDFDPKKLKPEILSLSATPKPNEKKTEAPTEVYEDNDTQALSDMVLEMVIEEENGGADEDDKFEAEDSKAVSTGEMFSTFVVAVFLTGVLVGAYYFRQLRLERANQRVKALIEGDNDGSFGLYKDSLDSASGVSLKTTGDSDSLQKFEAYSDQPDAKSEEEEQQDPATLC